MEKIEWQSSATIQQHAKHPVILPKSHHIDPLIICQYHHVSGHSGVLSLIGEKFWIDSARTAVRRYLNTCIAYKRRQAHIGEQKMADLPLDRITPDKPPFTYVGVDCFSRLVLYSTSRGFFSRNSGFPLSSKTNI